MTQEDDGVRAALQERFGKNEKEIERLLGCYVGVHTTVRGYFRKWLTVHLAEHAGWMLDYINVRLVAEVAAATGRVVTMPAKRGPGRIGVYALDLGLGGARPRGARPRLDLGAARSQGAKSELRGLYS